MADKPLQSITFPDLPDTYTVPQVDNTLSTQGAAADAKKTGDEITNLKADLNAKIEKIAVFSKNLLPSEEFVVESNGVKTVYADGIMTFSGTATATGGRMTARCSVTLPAGTYTFSLAPVSGTGATIQLTTNGGDYIGGVNDNNSQTVTIEETTTFILGFNSVNGTTYNTSVYIQCEKGSEKTTFEKPSASTAVDAVARETIEYMANVILGDGVTLVKSGNDLSIKSTFDGSEMTLSAYVTQSDTDNPCFDFGSYSGSFVKSATDDICPVFYNGSYRCARHGNNVIQQVTAPSHGLTEANIGEVFAADNINWVLIKIVNGNTLWFISEPVSGSTRPFSIALSNSGTLVGNTTIAYTGKTTVQLKPQNINRTYSIYVDNAKITSDGTYIGNEIKLIESYQSLDCINMVEYLKANVGNNTNESYHSDTIGGELQYSVTYSFYKNGGCTVNQSIIPLRDNIDVSNFGIVQAIKYADNAYVPFTTNFGGIATLPSSTVSFSPDTWADADFPPYKYYEIDPATGKGFALVFDISFGYGLPSIRKGLISNAGNFNGTSHKMYPNFIGKGTVITDGQIIAGNAVRMPIKMVDNGIGFYWYSGNALLVEIETFSATTVSVKIPKEYVGKNASIVKATNTIHLIDFVVADTNITVKSFGKGSATIKLN